MVHLGLAKYGLSHAEKLYKHRAEVATENKEANCFGISVHKVIQAKRSDIVLCKKKDRECLTIDVVKPPDSRAWSK